jgi:hypothetical protein
MRVKSFSLFFSRIKRHTLTINNSAHQHPFVIKLDAGTARKTPAPLTRITNALPSLVILLIYATRLKVAVQLVLKEYLVLE